MANTLAGTCCAADVCKNVNAAKEILRGSNQNMPDRLLVAAINCYLGLQNDELLYMHDDEMLLLVNKNYPT